MFLQCHLLHHNVSNPPRVANLATFLSYISSLWCHCPDQVSPTWHVLMTSAAASARSGGWWPHVWSLKDWPTWADCWEFKCWAASGCRFHLHCFERAAHLRYFWQRVRGFEGVSECYCGRIWPPGRPWPMFVFVSGEIASFGFLFELCGRHTQGHEVQ